MEKNAKPSRWIDIGEGCKRDAILYTRLDGSQFYREWTPWLGETTHRNAPAMAEACTLFGGSWSLPADPSVLITTLDYFKHSPAMHPDIADGKTSGWAWTAQIDPSISSLAFGVVLSNGRVLWNFRLSWGLVRACREVCANEC